MYRMTLCLITSGTEPETSFCIVLTGQQEATSSQPVTLLTMIWRREYLKLPIWNHLVLNKESALAMTTQILCPHAHVKTGQIGTYRVNTFSPSSSTDQHGSGVTYHQAIFTAHTYQLMLGLWRSILMNLLFLIWMMTMMSMMLNWSNSLHKICKLSIIYIYIITILCMLKLGWLEIVTCVGKQYKHLIVGIVGHVQQVNGMC